MVFSQIFIRAMTVWSLSNFECPNQFWMCKFNSEIFLSMAIPPHLLYINCYIFTQNLLVSDFISKHIPGNKKVTHVNVFTMTQMRWKLLMGPSLYYFRKGTGWVRSEKWQFLQDWWVGGSERVQKCAVRVILGNNYFTSKYNFRYFPEDWWQT